MRLSVLVLLAGCVQGDLDGVGLVGDGVMNPFPSVLHHDGTHLALDVSDLDVPDATPFPVERVAWREGFSPAQVAVTWLPNLRDEGLPDWHSASGAGDPVQLVDLDTGEHVPVMAELDAHPDAEDPVLLVRPQRALTEGHRMAVVVTTDVADRPDRFDALMRGRPVPGLEDVADHFEALFDDLEAVGVDLDSVALAWDYPVASGRAPLESAIAQIDAPLEYAFDRIRSVSAGDNVPPFTWRAAEGTLAVQDFMDGETLRMDASGAVSASGTTDYFLYAHVPDSVKDAPAGTVPVMIFGHGIFSSPESYLDNHEDADGVLALADEGGFIVVGTRWRGLSSEDFLDVVAVASDFGRLPSVTESLVQSQVAVRSLIELVRNGDLLDDPVFEGASGQSLANPEQVTYYGISLGGIEGAVLFGSGVDLPAGVLHVGGAQWATMLERSTQWIAFEVFIEDALPDPAQRQYLYAASQLYWDPVDPVSWVHGLRDQAVLWQESLGDEQVPNMTTRMLVRSVGDVPLLSPPVEPVWGLEVEDGPLGPGASAIAQFDSFEPLPEDVNRPPAVTDAHHTPRRWPGTRRQVIDFLAEGQEGTVVHHCGAGPCTLDNTGE